MKSKKFKFVKIFGIIIGVFAVILIILNLIIKNISNNLNDISETEISQYFNDYTVNTQNMTAFVKGTGKITSFNIQTLDIPAYSDVKEKFINDGDMVTAKQRILRAIIDGYSQNINSPIDGMYFEIEQNNQMVYQIYDLKNVGIEMLVSENDVALLKEGQKAFVKITALNKEIEENVSYISKIPQDGKFKVKVKIEYTDEIKFGYGVSVKILVAEKENVLVIPYNTLQMDNENKYYVIKSEYKKDFYKSYINNTIIPEKAKTYVEVGIITNNQVEITSGLKSGDVVEEWNM